MNATDPKYIASRAMMIVQSLKDGDDEPGDFDTAYGILCRFAVDVLNDAQGAVLDALRRPREEAHNALSHLSQRLYNMSKEVIDQLREPKGCGHGDD